MSHFTERELDVMSVLWRHGGSTVAQVRDQLEDALAYNTVLTVLRTLEEKGYISHREEGRAYRYFAKVTAEAARQTALGRMLDRLFGGSAELLVTHLVEDRDLSPSEVKRLRGLIDGSAKRSKRR